MASSSNDGDFADNSNFEECTRPSDEDTEDASETEAEKRGEEEFTGIKEQMYQDQLAQLKRQKLQLKEGTHVHLVKKIKRLEQQYSDTLRLIEIRCDLELQKIQRQYEEELKAAKLEFDEKKVELKETLLLELEHKRRQIDSERLTMDLAGDAIGIKQVNTRKLRRRPYDPAPVPEKRSKPSPVQLGFEIDGEEKLKDMALINKVCKPKVQQTVTVAAQPQRGSMNRGHT